MPTPATVYCIATRTTAPGHVIGTDGEGWTLVQVPEGYRLDNDDHPHWIDEDGVAHVK